MAVDDSFLRKYITANHSMSDRDIEKNTGVYRAKIREVRKSLQIEELIPVRKRSCRKTGPRLQSGEKYSEEFAGHIEMPCGKYRSPRRTKGGNWVNLYKSLVVCSVCGSRRLVSRKNGVANRNACSSKCLQIQNTGRVRLLKRDRGPSYMVVFNPTHHRADRLGNVREHILVAEAMIGRRLERNEMVHHIDCDGLNNKEENLHIFVGNAPHKRSHGSLNKCVKSLLLSGAIVFNRETGLYEVSR